MDTPEFMRMTPEQEAAGCRLYRFLDQIVLLDKNKKAIIRNFYPSINAAKRNNRYFARLPVLSANPPNGPNCQNRMVPDTKPITQSKAQTRLDVRLKAHADMCRRSAREGAEYTKPGSLKGRV